MKTPKVWLVAGAQCGLGAAAVKYLQSKKQTVIKIDTTVDVPPAILVAAIARDYGQVDFIINNANYYLFAGEEMQQDAHMNAAVVAGIAQTMQLLKVLQPLLRKHPAGRIINLPPQLCLAGMPPSSQAPLQAAMDFYCTALQQELQQLHGDITFLAPGERLAV